MDDMNAFYKAVVDTLKNEYKCSEEMLYVIATSTNHFFAFHDDGRPMHMIFDNLDGKKRVMFFEKWKYRKTNDKSVSVLVSLCSLLRIGFAGFSKDSKNLL